LIRRATEADLPEAAAIWYEAEVESEPGQAPPSPGPELFRHDLVTGDMYVAEVAGRVAGFSSSLPRGGVRFLSNLFVRRDVRETGLGRALTAAAMPLEDGVVRCTLSSKDPRAQALYARSGMRPRWPHFILQAEDGGVRLDPPGGLVAVEAMPGDRGALERWDRAVAGRQRPMDLDRWIAWGGAVPLWLERHGTRIGYSYVQKHSPGWLEHPEGATIGPIGVERVEDSVDCVLAAVAWAQERPGPVAIGVPGPHASLAPLLDAGFRIVYVELFMSSSEEDFADPRRYIPSGSDQF
jgi:GNAT superfamily N-acetyltransferase